jgi:4-hydroxy-3-polyprenylbenzoate decarboxylase
LSLRQLPQSLDEQRMKKLIIGISGASGVVYGIRILELLREREDVETHLVITDMGRATIKIETDYTVPSVEKLADRHYGIRDLAAAISSGSFETDGMIVAPCSVKSLSSIANCSNDNLLTRAADVTLKERRRLVLLFRETPLTEGHCRLMLDASRMGAVIMPPLPAFYTKPQTIEEIIGQTVGRVLDFWKVDLGISRWGE